MAAYSETIRLDTTGGVQGIDITGRVEAAIARSRVHAGLACVFTPSSTSAIIPNEFEPGLVEEDIPKALERLFPTSIEYGHERRWHDGNGHSHVRATFLGQSLTTTIDVIMVGSLGAEAPAAVAAVGFGGQFIFLFFSIMISVSAGTIALVARAIGRHDIDEANHVLKQSFVLGAFVSVPLTLMGLVFAEPILAGFGAAPDVVALGAAYTRIVSLVVFFQFISFLGNAALRGAGDTVTPLWIGVLVNVVNFGINVNLIYGNAFVPRLGVPGAAIGTSISYVVGALIL